MSVHVAVFGEHQVMRVDQIRLVAQRMGATMTHKVHTVPELLRLGELADATFVPLEITDLAIPLSEFQHPESAIYVLGPQHSYLPTEALNRMPPPVYVETPPGSPSPVLPTPVVLGVVLHHRLMQMAVAA